MSRSLGIDRALTFALPLLLLGATLWAYAGVFALGFVDYDDPFFVLDNPTVNGGLTREGLVRAFTTTHHGQWQPVSWVAHMLDVEWFGLQPRGHHATSLALHLINVLLVYAVFLRLTGARIAAGFVALCFALHPLHVESVAWISSKKDLVSLAFGLVALWLYAGHTEGSLYRAPLRFALVLVAHALALLGKPMLVTLPCVLLLLDAWPLGRWRGGPEAVRTVPASDRPGGRRERLGLGTLVLEKLPLLALSAVAAVVVRRAVEVEGRPPELDLGERLANALVSYGRYLRKAFWPSDLAASYPHPSLTVDGGWPAWTIALSAVVFVLGFALAWHTWPRRAYVAVGWLWFAGTLVPVLGLASLSLHSMADRYAYLPLLGIYTVVVFAVRDLAGRRAALRAGAVAAGLIVAVALGATTRAQTRTWRDTDALWRRALRVTENNYVAHTNLGRLFMERGDFLGARENYFAAIRARPDISDAYANLGVLFERQGEFGMARDAFGQALEREPDNVELLVNLGSVLLKLGRNAEALEVLEPAVGEPAGAGGARGQHAYGMALQRNGRIDEGLLALRRATELEPDSAVFQEGLGRGLLAAGRAAEGVEPLRRAVELDERLFAARVNLGLALIAGREPAAAREVFEAAARIDPNEPVVHRHLGALLLDEGELEAAATHLEAALQLGLDAPEVHLLLAYASERLGRYPRAVAHYEVVLAREPDSALTYNNLAGALWRSGKLDEARAAYLRAIELEPGLAQAHSNLGLLNQAFGDLTEAARRHRRALELDPAQVASADNLAWILATCPDASLRNGAEAVRWAEYALEHGDPPQPRFLSTLAAAYAEAGRFDEAVAKQLQVVEQVPEHRKGEHAERLELYRRGEPYRDRPLSER